VADRDPRGRGFCDANDALIVLRLGFAMSQVFSDASLSAIVRDLAPSGRLRAAINVANGVLAQRIGTDGELGGVSVDIARELGTRLDVPVDLVVFEAAGRVFEALDRDEWDLAFLAIEPARAARVSFSLPYIAIEGTYIVRKDARFAGTTDLDRDGVRIVVTKNAAYDLYLTRTLRRAQIVRAPTPAAALESFVESNLDAAAGVRQSLENFAESRTGFRTLPNPFMAIEQALAMPQGRPAAHAYLAGFIGDLKVSGWLRDALDRNGQIRIPIAPT
jgi:polar amino acid transport system substrate-binding protein